MYPARSFSIFLFQVMFREAAITWAGNNVRNDIKIKNALLYFLMISPQAGPLK
jgi:hypothetical protein